MNHRGLNQRGWSWDLRRGRDDLSCPFMGVSRGGRPAKGVMEGGRYKGMMGVRKQEAMQPTHLMHV